MKKRPHMILLTIPVIFGAFCLANSLDIKHPVLFYVGVTMLPVGLIDYALWMSNRHE